MILYEFMSMVNGCYLMLFTALGDVVIQLYMVNSSALGVTGHAPWGACWIFAQSAPGSWETSRPSSGGLFHGNDATGGDTPW